MKHPNDLNIDRGLDMMFGQSARNCADCDQARKERDEAVALLRRSQRCEHGPVSADKLNTNLSTGEYSALDCLRCGDSWYSDRDTFLARLDAGKVTR